MAILEYNYRNEGFGISDEYENNNRNGWYVIDWNITHKKAIDFIEYAHKNLLINNKSYSWLQMQKELKKYLEGKT